MCGQLYVTAVLWRRKNSGTDLIGGWLGRSADLEEFDNRSLLLLSLIEPLIFHPTA